MYSLAVKNRTTQYLKDYGKGIAQAIRGTGLFFPTAIYGSILLYKKLK